MTEVPIEVGYRSYIKLLRKKWDIVYYGKDLYFSHANKILEPYYDSNTKEFFGVETNPTRLAIVKFLDQFRDGPGIYEPETFPDLLKHSVVYSKRVKLRKPYSMSRHQESHPSLQQAKLEDHYRFQDRRPLVRRLEPEDGEESFPYQNTFLVEDHPYEKMIGRVWTHIYIPSPADLTVLDDFKSGTGYSHWLRLACSDGHDMIIVEPITTQFYVKMVKRMLCCGNYSLQIMYSLSIFRTCHHPHKMEWNLLLFLAISMCHLIFDGCMKTHPLGKYKLPDRFHDIEALAELKYFKEVLPVITSKNLVICKDEKKELKEPRRILNVLHFINLFVLGYNYMYGIDYWYVKD